MLSWYSHQSLSIWPWKLPADSVCISENLQPIQLSTNIPALCISESCIWSFVIFGIAKGVNSLLDSWDSSLSFKLTQHPVEWWGRRQSGLVPPIQSYADIPWTQKGEWSEPMKQYLFLLHSLCGTCFLCWSALAIIPMRFLSPERT